MATLPRITVISSYLPEVQSSSVEGIAKYCGKFGPWSLCLLHAPASSHTVWADRDFCKADGFIAFNVYPEMQSRIVQTGKPAVAVNTGGNPVDLPAITYDDPAIGRMAGEHLADLGIKRIGYVGCGSPFSHEREQGLTEAVFARGLPAPRRLALVDFRTALERPLRWVARELRAWTKEDKGPVSVFCANDRIAVQLIQSCADCDLLIPEEVCVIGVDNLTWLCETARVPLTSIDRGSELAGYQAANLLARMLRGESGIPRIIRIPPTGVVTRRSTDLLDADYPELTQAMHFIRDYACEGITIDDLVQAVPISRRSLSRLFKQRLGSSPGDEIQRYRLKRARRLLAETDIALAEVAIRSGFGWSASLVRAFKAKYHVTPAMFRRESRRSTEK